MRQQSIFVRQVLYWLSMAAGLVLAIVPLPNWLDPVRPDLALLAMIYFVLTSPRVAGLGFAWFSGLFLDVLRGMVLGQHALGFLIVGYATHKIQLQMRMFPILQQALPEHRAADLHLSTAQAQHVENDDWRGKSRER